MTVVYEPKRDLHYFCEVPLDHVPHGTVVACEECGRTWVACLPRHRVWANFWRPEKRRERKRREAAQAAEVPA